MRTWILVLAALGLAACGGDDTTPKDTDTAVTDGDADTDTDADTDVPCTATVVDLSPADSATDVGVTTPVIATFSEPVTAFTLEVDGVPGVATLAADGLSATFVGDAPFDTDSSYTATATVCDSTVSSHFSTVGGGLSGGDLVGGTYGLRFTDIVFTDPPQAALDILGIDIDWILVQVVSSDAAAETLGADAATAYDGATGSIDIDCASAVDEATIGTIDFSTNPAFALGPTLLSIPYGTDFVNVTDFALSGEFTQDGGAIDNVSLSGIMDTRDFLPVPPLLTDCKSLSLFGIQCVPCTDGKKECTPLTATTKTAALLPGVDIAGTCGI